jgi:hypothetical protein
MELGVRPTRTLVKWILITLCSFCFAVMIYFLEGTIDRYIRPYCPPGYWHEGFWWAHCAIPAISIAKHVLIYCIFSLICIILVYYIKPEPLLKSIKIVFYVLLTIPILHVFFNGISWASVLSFISVAIIFLFARFLMYKKMHNKRLW